MEEVLAAIPRIGYSGWLVAEQDIFPDPAEPAQAVAARQVAKPAVAARARHLTGCHGPVRADQDVSCQNGR